jgi:hypothetical protein
LSEVKPTNKETAVYSPDRLRKLLAVRINFMLKRRDLQSVAFERLESMLLKLPEMELAVEAKETKEKKYRTLSEYDDMVEELNMMDAQLDRERAIES